MLVMHLSPSCIGFVEGVKQLTNKPLRWELYILAICCIFALLACLFPPKSTSTLSQEESVFVPIIMYHSLLADSSKAGQYSDLRYLLGQGYETIVMQDLIDYVYHGKDLPENPVIITFDDGSGCQRSPRRYRRGFARLICAPPIPLSGFLTA